jgi:Alginate export
MFVANMRAAKKNSEKSSKKNLKKFRWQNSSVSNIGSLAFAAFLASWFFAPAAQAQYFALARSGYPLEFYDIDFSYLADPAKRTTASDAMHYISLGLGPDSYISLGGQIREQAWVQNNEAHGLKAPVQNTYDLQRLMGDVYVHFDRHFAVFVQLDNSEAMNKVSPSVTDETGGRIQQGFLELKEDLGPAQFTTRVGRQEIVLGSGRFVWVNDSSNVRTTHDGARIHIDNSPIGTLDFVATRPVTSTYDAFTDFDSHNGTFASIYASQPFFSNQLHVDEYYFYRHNIGAQYAGLTGNEERDTVGGRIWGAFGWLKYDSDFAYQFGSYDNKEISAFGTSTRAVYTLEDVTWQPGLQVQTSYFSGTGGPNSKTIGTFSAPFPRPTMLNYVGLETLENLIEAYPAFIVNPASNFAFRFGPQFLWRASVYDDVYISRTTPLTATVSAKDRASYIGTNLVATATWNVTQNIDIFAEYLHEIAGPAITLAGGRGTDAGVLQVDFNF